MKHCALSIVMKEDHSIDVRIEDPHGLEMLLIGGLEFAKQSLVEKIYKTKTIGNTMKNTSTPSKETKMTKDEAMKFYMEYGKTIQQRILSIHNADDQAEFLIDNSLLENIQ